MRLKLWTRDAIAEALRMLHGAGTDLTPHTIRSTAGGLYEAARREFGTYAAALGSAGIDPATIYTLRRRSVGQGRTLARYHAVRRQGGRVPAGYWSNEVAARTVLSDLWGQLGISADAAPAVCTRRWFERHGLGSLLSIHGNSPRRVLQALFPGRYSDELFHAAGQYTGLSSVTCGRCRDRFSVPAHRVSLVRYCPYCGTPL